MTLPTVGESYLIGEEPGPFSVPGGFAPNYDRPQVQPSGAERVLHDMFETIDALRARDKAIAAAEEERMRHLSTPEYKAAVAARIRAFNATQETTGYLDSMFRTLGNLRPVEGSMEQMCVKCLRETISAFRQFPPDEPAMAPATPRPPGLPGSLGAMLRGKLDRESAEPAP